MQQAQPRGLPGLAKKGLGEPERSGEAPSRLFRGWQANPNSILSDGVLQRAKEECLRLQMDVWFCAPQEPTPRGTNGACAQRYDFSKAALPSTSKGQLRLPY
jgi:hypothetical protein